MDFRATIHDGDPPAALIRPHGPQPEDHTRLPEGGHILTHFDQVPALARELACAS